MNVFPAPSVCIEEDGLFVFGEKEKLYLIIGKDIKNPYFVEKCSELWRNFTAGKSGLEVIIKDDFWGCAVISKKCDAGPIHEKTDYEYELDCSENGVNIIYTEEHGLIHGFSTLLQMISPFNLKSKNFNIPCCKMCDRPILKMRGVHLCVFPETSLLFLRKVVRLCGLLKCSHIIIEFWGMYKFRFMKEMGWEDGYSAEDLKPIIEDGKAFGIEFIPMFNHLGHASQSRFKAGKNVLLDNAPEYEEYFEPGGWTWKISNPDVRILLRSVREELIDLFREGEYFHVGCDEAYMADGDDDGLNAEQNKAFVNFLNETADEIKASGRKMIMWGDMFLNKDRYPFPYCNNVSNRCTDSENNLKKLSSGIIIDDWQYNVGEDMDETVKFFVGRRDKDSIILSPWAGYESVSYTDNINGRCALAKKYGLLGVIATTWNKLHKDPKELIYAACQMWSEDNKYADRRSWEVYKCFGMQNVRKLLPSGGVREKSGWIEGENIIDYI